MLRSMIIGRLKRYENALLRRGIGISRNNRGLLKLRNSHRGRRAVIVGMGPSLKVSDLDRLTDCVSFACNKIYLAFGDTVWRPDYYSVCDVVVSGNNHAQILATDFGGAQPIHLIAVKEHLGRQKKAVFYAYSPNDHFADWPEGKPPALPQNPVNGLVGGGRSVVIDQIQLAYAAGCSEVILIGVDFNFTLGNVTSTISAAGQIVESRGEVNHFHPDYRKPGEKWTMPLLDDQRRAFAFCERAFAREGRRLVNASRATKLDVVPRANFDDLFPAK